MFLGEGLGSVVVVVGGGVVAGLTVSSLELHGKIFCSFE